MTATTAVSALQAALAAENAAIFGYGVAGAHLTGNSLAAAEQDWTTHNEARDTLAAMIRRLGAAPTATQAFYQLPFRGARRGQRDGARGLPRRRRDQGLSRPRRGQRPALRRFGALAMQVAAQRAAFWRGSTQAFPGLSTP